MTATPHVAVAKSAGPEFRTGPPGSRRSAPSGWNAGEVGVVSVMANPRSSVKPAEGAIG